MKNTATGSFKSILLKFSLTLFVATLVSVFLVLAPAPAFAETVRGFVHTDASTKDISLLIRTAHEPYRVVASLPSVLAGLRNLKDGDFIIGSGTVKTTEKLVVLDSLESVGLQELLGVWRTAEWQVFEFRDFNRLNLYKATPETYRPVGLSKLREYAYVLAPEQGDRYSIFLSDDQSVHVGSLEVSATKVQMTVFDPDTGRVAESISLSPLPLQ